MYIAPPRIRMVMWMGRKWASYMRWRRMSVLVQWRLFISVSKKKRKGEGFGGSKPVPINALGPP
jgi:hypothetical protein